MIEGFRHKGLRRFYENDDRKLLPPELVQRIRDILTALDAAETLEGLDRPTFRLHALKGERKGYWAVTVRANWRIVFRFTDGADIDELGLTLVDAAKGLGISRQQLHSVIVGRAGVTPEMAIRLEKAIGSTADTWLRMQMNYDLTQVRKRAINVKRLAPT